MSEHSINKVRKFHEVYGHPIASAPNSGTRELRELRVRLIAEELLELAESLGVYLDMRHVPAPHYDPRAVQETRLRRATSQRITVTSVWGDEKVDLVEAADALGDLDYVVQGANLVFGFPAEAVIEEIQRSNMSKLGEDGHPIYRDDGKVMKGPNYSPPNIAAVLSGGKVPGLNEEERE